MSLWLIFLIDKWHTLFHSYIRKTRTKVLGQQNKFYIFFSSSRTAKQIIAVCWTNLISCWVEKYKAEVYFKSYFFWKKKMDDTSILDDSLERIKKLGNRCTDIGKWIILQSIRITHTHTHPPHTHTHTNPLVSS